MIRSNRVRLRFSFPDYGFPGGRSVSSDVNVFIKQGRRDKECYMAE